MNSVNRLREASEWVQRLGGAASEADFVQWQRWCDAHPDNLKSFDEMQKIWEGFSPERVARVIPGPGAPAVLRARGRKVAFAVAATVLIAVGAAGWGYFVLTAAQSYETRIGETRQERLADGSNLHLGADSEVTLGFSRQMRTVTLNKGQGYFAVAKDARRPFVVQAGELTITAVGTAFDVRMGAQDTVVTVGDGRVRVDAPQAGEPLYLDAGQSGRYSGPLRAVAVREVDPHSAQSWRDGVLQFQEEPLQDVIATVNRYSGRRVVLEDSRLAQTPFTGTISPDRMEDLFLALEKILPVTVEQRDREVLIKRR